MVVNKVEICGVNTSKLPLLTNEEKKMLFERIQKGDKEARERLVEENMGLVWSIVKRFAGRGTDMEDLFQIGAMGLIKAIDKFDPSFEVKFSTYAVPMIAGEIKRFLRDDGIVKVSRTLKENCWKIKKETEQFRQKNGREPSLEELSVITGLTKEEIAMALESAAEVESIYKTIPQKDGSEVCLLDRMESQNQGGRDAAPFEPGSAGTALKGAAGYGASADHYALYAG